MPISWLLHCLMGRTIDRAYMFSFWGFSELSSFNDGIFDIPEERARLSEDGVGETISAQAHESLFPTLAISRPDRLRIQALQQITLTQPRSC